jgi:hypothetical protein
VRSRLYGVLWLAALCAWPRPAAAAAHRTLGYQDCEKCHKAAVSKWLREEPGSLGAKAHANTHKQLTGDKAAQFARAIGLANPADPGGRCASCHATVVRRRVRSGVSCESCHGAANDYLGVHDKEPWRESYKKSLPLGMRDLHGKPDAIARLCVGCHVTPDQALAAAGHPNGKDFDAGASLKKLVHWTAAFTPDQKEHAQYDFAQVTSLAKPMVAAALQGRGAAPRPAAASSAGPAPRPAPATTAASPWDWNAAVPMLPADYPSDASGTTAAAAAPSIAQDLPLQRDELPAVGSPAPPPRTGPKPTAAELSELRGRAAVLLARLISEGRRTPRLEEPPKPGEFKGPDGELLHLQDVVLYLALETLRGHE